MKNGSTRPAGSLTTRRTIALALGLLGLLFAAGIFLKPRALDKTPLPLGQELDLRTRIARELAELSPEERDRREAELLSPYAAKKLVAGPQALAPEEQTIPARARAIPKGALWKGPGDTAPDGTATDKPRKRRSARLPETTSDKAPRVTPAYEKPPDPPERARRER